MIYRAFMNRKEIRDFCVGEKASDALYGGRVLLWKKEEQKKRCECWYDISESVTKYGSDVVNRYGFRFEFNDEAKVTKMAIFTSDYSGIDNTNGGARYEEHFLHAFVKGENITYANAVKFLGYYTEDRYTEHDIVYDDLKSYSMQESENKGIWGFSVPESEEYEIIYNSISAGISMNLKDYQDNYVYYGDTGLYVNGVSETNLRKANRSNPFDSGVGTINDLIYWITQ